jgi:hypothetical protein
MASSERGAVALLRPLMRATEFYCSCGTSTACNSAAAAAPAAPAAGMRCWCCRPVVSWLMMMVDCVRQPHHIKLTAAREQRPVQCHLGVGFQIRRRDRREDCHHDGLRGAQAAAEPLEHRLLSRRRTAPYRGATCGLHCANLCLAGTLHGA